ncbi:MAG TPA: hypothetical protein VKB69_15825, partial [Micromonosporaceae bacterium]|nr:hypothetical protein [Micromonosporaceae bacterium]
AKRSGRKAAKQARSTWSDVAEAMGSAANRTRQAASGTAGAAQGFGREAGRRARDTKEALAGRGSKRRGHRHWSWAALLTGLGLGALVAAISRRLADRNAERLEHLEQRFAEVDAEAAANGAAPVWEESEPMSGRLNGAGTADRLAGTATTADRVAGTATTRPVTPTSSTATTGQPTPAASTALSPRVDTTSTGPTAVGSAPVPTDPTAVGTAPVPADLPTPAPSAPPAADTPAQQRRSTRTAGGTATDAAEPEATPAKGKDSAGKGKTGSTPTDR